MSHAHALPSRQELRRADRERRFGKPPHPVVLENLAALADLVRLRPRPPLFKCCVVGIAITLVYVYPVELLTYLTFGEFSHLLFNLILLGAFVLGTSWAWVLTARELRRWERMHPDELPENDFSPEFKALPPWH